MSKVGIAFLFVHQIGDNITIRMIGIVRKVVAGPKRTTSYEGEQLDLTYITDRVIAMAFPASDFIEKTYRNNIQDVASYLDEEHHSNYLIINVSSRNYNYTIFGNRVNDYQWPDHQTPPFTTLIQAAYDMYAFLATDNRKVVAVHCNHGKGRTGTAIIALLQLVGFLKSAKQCLTFYNSKRFNKSTYGVDQPCQLRYLQFLEEAINCHKIDEKLICYRLKGIVQKGLSNDYSISITCNRSQLVLHDKLHFNKHNKDGNAILMADIFIELFCENWSSSKRVARVNYNLHFLKGETKLKLRGQDIKVAKGYPSDFEIGLHLEYYCLCHLPTYQGSNCRCQHERSTEEKLWSRMREQLAECRRLTRYDTMNLLYFQKKDHSPKKEKEYPSNSESPPKSESALKKEFALKKASFLKLHQSLDGKPFKSTRQQMLHAKYLTSKKMKIRAADQEEGEGQHEGLPLGLNLLLSKQWSKEEKPPFSSSLQG